MRRVAVAVLSVLCCAGCAGLPRPLPHGQKQAEAYTPAFQWAPPATNAPSSAGVAFLLMAQDSPPSTERSIGALLNNFGGRLAEQVKELLVARGYTVRDRLKTGAEIPYQDKKESDLLLDLSTSLTIGGQVSKDEQDAWTWERFNLAGTTTVSCATVAAIREPFSKELMANEEAKCEEERIPWRCDRLTKDKAVAVRKDIETLKMPESVVLDDVARYLDASYRQILSTLWDRLDPAAMKPLKAQADELRKKTVGLPANGP